MRLIYEENVEREDFIEITLSPEECEQLSKGGVVGEFDGALHENRNLNIYLRIDPNYIPGDIEQITSLGTKKWYKRLVRAKKVKTT